MPRKKLHKSVNDRVKAHRHSKLESSNTKLFCSVCNVNILCNSDPALSLARHKSSSSKHKRLLQGIYFVDDSDSDMEVAEADSSIGCGEPCSGSPADSSTDGNPSTKHVRFESPIDAVLSEDDIVPFEMEVDAAMSIEVDRIPDEREFLLMNTILAYGKKTEFHLHSSPILSIQEKLLQGFDNIVRGISPYEFNKVKNREVDWINALEVTRDFIDSNESIPSANRRLQTMSNGMRRETGNSSRLPKRMDTLLHAFCNDLEQCSSIRQWKGGFFDEFLDSEKKKATKKTGLRWTPLKGHYVPLESAIAQMLLRLNVEDFDHCRPLLQRIFLVNTG